MLRKALILLLALAGNALAQEHYASGQFPAGKVYTDQTVRDLIDQPVPNPSYLVGTFAYLDTYEGLCFFTSFGAGLTSPRDIAFGDLLVGVRFFDNAPRLAPGKAIVPNPNDPLTIKRVARSKDGRHVLVFCESWSIK